MSPHGPITIHVAEGDIGRIGIHAAFLYAGNNTLLIHQQPADISLGGYPKHAFAIQVVPHAWLAEDAFQSLPQLRGLRGRDNHRHGAQVYHLGTLIETYPKTLIRVFHDIAARVAAHGEALSSRVHIAVAITVITRQPAALRANPHKALAVFIDIIHEVSGQTRTHVQVSQTVFPYRPCRCRNGHGKQSPQQASCPAREIIHTPVLPMSFTNANIQKKCYMINSRAKITHIFSPRNLFPAFFAYIRVNMPLP